MKTVSVTKEDFLNRNQASQYLDQHMREQDAMYWSCLQKQAERQGLTLCLGAGVSFGIGLPLWGGLLRKLLEGLCIHQQASKTKYQSGAMVSHEVIQSLMSVLEGKTIFQSVGALETAEYIQLYLADRALEECTRNGLENAAGLQATTFMASDVLAVLQDAKKRKGTKADWSLLDSLADLVMCQNGVRQIITYNYDDALERACFLKSAKYAEAEVKSFGLRDCVYQPDCAKTNIYHVHGKLSIYRGSAADIAKDVRQGVILSESSYMDVEKSAYIPMNTCQAHLFQSSSCLFIGFSAQDYNYRRIVRGDPLSREEEKRVFRRIEKNDLDDAGIDGRVRFPHFIFYPVDSLVDEVYGSRKDQKDQATYNQTCDLIIRNMLGVQRNYYQKQNVWPIFVRYGEIPGRINQLVKAAIRGSKNKKRAQ